MSNETIITVRGYAGASPLVFDNGERGKVAQVSVGVTPRSYSRELGDFKNGTTVWYTIRCYGRLALNVAESVRKGDPVLVRGRLTESPWTDREGKERSRLTITADSVGIELTTGVARFQRTADPARSEGEDPATEGQEPAAADTAESDSPDGADGGAYGSATGGDDDTRAAAQVGSGEEFQTAGAPF